MGVVAAGVGLDFVLTGHGGTAERWILAGGLSVTLLALAVMLYVSVNPYDPRTTHKAVIRMAAIPVVLLVAAFGDGMAMGMTTTILAIVIAVEVLSDLVFEPHKTGHAEG